VPLPLPMLPLLAITLQGSYVGSLGELRDLMALVQRTKMDLIPITTAALEQAQETLVALEHGKLVAQAKTM